MRTSLNSTDSRKICAIVFDDVDFDSRFKRAIKALSSFSHSGSIYALRKSSNLTYPFELKTSRKGRKGFLFECLKWILEDRPEVVFAGGLLPLVPGALLKPFLGYLLIYDARELYLKDGNGRSTYSNLHRIIEKLFSPLADIVIAANEDRAQVMAKYYRREIQVVRNISDEIDSREPRKFDTSQLKSHKFLVYQGHLGETRGLEYFVRALPTLDDRYRLLVIARGQGLDLIKLEAKELGVEERIIFSDYLQPPELHGILKKCFAGLLIYRGHGPNLEYCEPNKLYEYARCHLPSISSHQERFSRLFKKYDIGFCLSKEAWAGSQDHINKELNQGLSSLEEKSGFDKFNRDHLPGVDLEKLMQRVSSALNH